MSLDISVTQRRFFALAGHEPALRPQNITSVFQLRGELDPEAIKNSLHDALARHGLLRVAYSSDGLAFEERAVTHEAIAYRTVAWSDEALIGELSGLAQSQQARIFPPGECPLLKATLLCVNGKQWFLILTVDHMISDGLSIGMLIREMCILYLAKKRGRAPPLPATQATFGDHVREEVALLRAEGAARRQWWEGELRGYAPPYPKEPDALGPIGAVRSVIPGGVFGKMVAAARAQDRSISTILLCAYAIAVKQAGIGEDILVNKIVSNRSEAMRGVFGDFIDLIPIRFRPGPPDVPRLLAEAEARVEAAQANHLPYWALTEWLFPDFYLHPHGMCNVWFNYFPPHSPRLMNTPTIAVELVSDLTPAPTWAPCSVCVNIQPMLTGEAEIVVLSNSADVPEAGRLTILRTLEQSIEATTSWLNAA